MTRAWSVPASAIVGLTEVDALRRFRRAVESASPAACDRWSCSARVPAANTRRAVSGRWPFSSSGSTATGRDAV